MMIIGEADFTSVLLLSTALLLAAASLAIVRIQRLVRDSAQLSSRGAPAESKPSADTEEALEQRIRTLQEIVEDLARKEKKRQPTGRHDMPIENAVRMAKCGAGVDELTRSCGLKKGEAELLLRLHANREQTAVARAQ
jgi:Skp family chaperone for outer membrane proteins